METVYKKKKKKVPTYLKYSLGKHSRGLQYKDLNLSLSLVRLYWC